MIRNVSDAFDFSVAQSGTSLVFTATETATAGTGVLYVGGVRDDRATGTVAADVIKGGGGNDVLTGGAGDDNFVFAPAFGTDRITDFTAGSASDDVIDLTALALVNGFSDLTVTATNNGAGTRIITPGGDVIILSGVAPSDLDPASDFLF